jgi:hypothetical protein
LLLEGLLEGDDEEDDEAEEVDEEEEGDAWRLPKSEKFFTISGGAQGCGWPGFAREVAQSA